MSRVDFLSEDRLTEFIDQLQKDALEFKSNQFASGASGRLGYLTQTVSTWDATGTVSGTSSVYFTVSFTGDGVQTAPFTQLLFDLFIDVPNDEAHRISHIQDSYDDGTDTAIVITNNRNDAYPSHDETIDGTARRTMLETGNQMKWRVELFYDGTITYYFKAYVISSDRGTLSVT